MTSVAHSGAGIAEPLDAESSWSNDAFSFWKLPESWRGKLAQSVADSQKFMERLLFEEYLESRHAGTLNAYYRIKKFIPRTIRHWINYAAVHSRSGEQFPHWPCETALIDFSREWLKESMVAMGETDAWHIGFWPEGKRCAIVLTHDVEGPVGVARMERMADLEQRFGFLSSWNLPLNEYEIDWKVIERLRARGFEIGAHGLAHDGRMFRSWEDFQQCKVRLEELASEHQMIGYRGPSTLRNPKWIAAMNFEYDSSFADTDPYEPQPGGTCSLFPFFLSRVVELPYTLAQDHTLLHLVRRNPVSLWATKARWIQSLGGMILSLVHPDYSGDETNIRAYEELLKILADFDDAWRALPREVASWWRDRARMRLLSRDGVPVIDGPQSSRAVARLVSEEGFLA
jgi:peptidoglycan/xylan/chitin deacetylase (PgdA/CDA1 family)